MGIFGKQTCRLSAHVLFICWVMFLVLPGLLFAECPQNRETPTAPEKYLTMKSPVPLNDATLKAGENIFQLQGKPIACKTCHGAKGDGIAESGFESTPPPRNFTCAETMKALSNGQLFLDHPQRITQNLHVRLPQPVRRTSLAVGPLHPPVFKIAGPPPSVTLDPIFNNSCIGK